ncbi:MAG: serine hydrolase domain-containing protein [Acidobacteriota bacterium]
MRSKRIALSFILVMVALAGTVPLLRLVRSKQTSTAEASFADLERVVLSELSETNTPGAAIGIVRGDRLVFARGFGVANIETGEPVRPEMLFRLGSTTKMFTAAGLLKLVEARKIDLDSPIGKYAKGLDPAIARITPAQLLSHSAGLRDAAVMFGKHDDAELGVTVRALNEQSLFTEPGRVYSYANPGYWLAGYVTEEVSGRAYADELSESLFKPLGMTRTTIRPTMAITFPLAQGHDGSPTEKPHVIRPLADNAGNWPAGSMFSSITDLSRFVIAFMNGGRIDGVQVLSRELISMMSTPRVEIPGTDSKYAFGLNIGTFNGVRVVQHGGSRSGFGSLIRMFPDKQIAVILLINRTGGSLNKTVRKVTELLIPGAAREDSKPRPREMTALEMARYVGGFGEGADRITISIKAGQLVYARGRFETPLVRINDSRLSAVQAGQAPAVEIGIAFASDGRAEFLILGGRALKRAP